MIKKTIKEFAKDFSLKPLDIDGFIAYSAPHEHIAKLLRFVKENKDLRFTVLTDLFAADFLEKNKRFEVVYSLLSLKLNKRLMFKTALAEKEQIDSVTKIFSAACWYEREIFDMYGIEFKNSPDMRRILTDYGFTGHPLRKDFPLSGHLQVKYDEKEEKVVYEPVNLEQEYRDFDFVSEWEGPGEYKLPGDEKATKE